MGKGCVLSKRLLIDVMLSGLQNGIQQEIMEVFLCLIIGGAVAEAGHSCQNGVQIGIYLRQWDICCTPSADLGKSRRGSAVIHP